MLILSRKVGESIIINDNIEVVITDVSGDKVKIGFKAPKNIPIFRKEIIETKKANKSAVSSIDNSNLSSLAAALHEKT